MRLQLIIIALALATAAFNISAQNTLDSLLLAVEQNNTRLSAFRQQAEAEKIGNKTGLNPENPEIEYSYLWGNNEVGGNQTEFSVTQSFDFPTAYYHKRKVAGAKDQQIDLQYQIERKDILLETKLLYIDLVYQQALLAELNIRQQHVQQIMQSIQGLFDKGEASILDLNKVKLNILNINKTINTAQIEQELMLSELTRFNGNQPVRISMATYPASLLATDFETWYAGIRDNNLLLQYWANEVAVSKANERLQRSLNLPKISAGYMNESILGEKLQGVIFGVTIPLWENKNTVRHIKAQTIAAQATEMDVALRYYNEAKARHNKASQLQAICTEFKTTLSKVSNSDLLKKALDLGEISLINYFLELSIYYDAVDAILETERDYHRTVAELNQWMLF